MIGIIGGYGAVGAHTVRLLDGWGAGPLRIGGRRPERAALLPGSAEAVDITDDASLDRFVRDCELVINCAGPSHRTARRVVRAALATGAHHVDAGGAESPGQDTGDRTVLLHAGALPGLSGLLPRWLAGQGFDTVHELTAYAGVLDRFTAGAAEDYLHGILGAANEPLAAWQDGARRSAALTRRAGLRLPFLPRPVLAHPYLDAEGAELARELRLRRGRWYSLLDGEHLGPALDAARTLERAEAVARLVRATALDTVGRTPYVNLLVQLDGLAGGRPIARTAILRGPGIDRLTGAVTAVAALAVLRGEVPPGVRTAASALDARTAVARLLGVPGLCRLTLSDLTIDDLASEEEGLL
ncbi:saccharopine dehydrogenase NADP-binding domain-containing protein [Kitasatospora sp. NPDC057015]|uniref:saccharopine dehydrogenase NADP-binding domain-containing protein n=1 Tax=Kitasatospora sp. NPDC057015 TaxID=3346001 RepID=UPI0036297582